MQTVFVGLSGGVDSAVSAYLLKKQGYEVIGAFIKGWEPHFLSCTGTEDRLSAMQVAAHLNIPFIAYDLEEEYKSRIVDYFVNEYKKGRTPNPDVMCNRIIKFGEFWRRTQADGADAIATGHYAENMRTDSAFDLLVSKDTEKDQTYFLWTLTQEDLSHTLFPIGSMTKSEVRKLAEKIGLPNAKRKDSQGLCFLGHVDMAEFLKRYIPAQSGIVRDESGTEIGKHSGVWFYTIGQRRGFSVPSSEPYYVVGKDIEKNEIIASKIPSGEHPKKEYAFAETNWISGTAPKGGLFVRYRYRQPLLPASFENDKIVFETPQLIAPGQSLVFYDADKRRCVGGAVAL
ncbi:MAG: tRNA 2-thiouridine(34) synthase MnmA [Patescibacteria group bacterium]|nr:tRNA 2-thiouridine(34) synthase MnmA [Patescibacteria group bacterium]